jgi:anti-sigma factor RsiW
MTPNHPRDALNELLDRRLGPTEQSALELHLRECPSCRAELAALKRTQAALRGLADQPLPLGFKLSLDPTGSRRKRALVWGVAAAAVLALLVLGAWFLRQPASQDLPSRVDRVWNDVQSGGALQLRSSSATELDRFLRERGLPFEPRVFDLAMMGWQLEGASVRQVENRRVGLWVYRTTDGRRLACVMLLGSMGELPRTDWRVEHQGRPFHVYQRAGRTLVFWPEGRVLCALVGTERPAEVLALAKAKAMGPPHGPVATP